MAAARPAGPEPLSFGDQLLHNDTAERRAHRGSGQVILQPSTLGLQLCHATRPGFELRCRVIELLLADDLLLIQTLGSLQARVRQVLTCFGLLQLPPNRRQLQLQIGAPQPD